MATATALHRIPTESVADLALAGNALLTLKSPKTGDQITLKIKQSKDGNAYFVSYNYGYLDFAYAGWFPNRGLNFIKFDISKASKIDRSSKTYKVCAWFFRNLGTENLDQVEVYHHTQCCKCGRTLTDSKSIQLGIGPKCRGER